MKHPVTVLNEKIAACRAGGHARSKRKEIRDLDADEFVTVCALCCEDV